MPTGGEGISLGGICLRKLGAPEKVAGLRAGGRRSVQSSANDLRGNRTAVVSQLRWRVTATDVPNICGELITHR